MNSFFKNYGLLLSGLLASVLILSPTYRTHLTSFVEGDSRTILGTLTFKVNNSKFKVVKLRKSRDILVEVYRIRAGDTYTLVNTFNIPDSKDLFYDSQTSMTNLFSANIDNDAGPEVVVPVLDENLVAHLNVLKFDNNTRKFSQYSLKVER